MPFLEARGLSKTYRNAEVPVEVFRDVTIAVEKGEMLAIVGPSGIGKSTLLHLLGGLDRPDGGEIRVGDRDLTSMSNDELAKFRNRNVGFVFQFHHLLPEFNARENVILPQLVQGAAPTAAHDRAEQLLGALGLGKRLDHRPAKLSGGEQQRVAVARALANKPPLVLADEPTGNLDEHTADIVFGEFLNLVRGEGSAALVATHNERIAAKMDRVVRLHEGRLE
jgi:lipoprotein-releasing system ATP-binding protein